MTVCMYRDIHTLKPYIILLSCSTFLEVSRSHNPEEHNLNVQCSDDLEYCTFVRIGSTKMTAVNIGGGKKWHVLLIKLKVLSSDAF